VQSIRRFSGQRSLVIDREDGLPTNLHQNLVEVCAIGEFSAMLKLQSAIQESLPLDLKAVLVRNVGIQKMSVLEVFENECSKLSGVHWVRDQLGLHTVIAAGDDENDIELLGGADVSLVMDHAAEHVLKAGKIKISGPSGLRHYLQKEWLDETS
jgi:hydroxymethylpyrimidine pyrophosphatase-like HAD family hydrolase